jgi:hypothetical protein
MSRNRSEGRQCNLAGVTSNVLPSVRVEKWPHWSRLEAAVQGLRGESLSSVSLRLEERGLGRLASPADRELQTVEAFAKSHPSPRTVVGTIDLGGLEQIERQLGAGVGQFVWTRALEAVQPLLERYGGTAELASTRGRIAFACCSGLSRTSDEDLLRLLLRVIGSRVGGTFVSAVLTGFGGGVEHLQEAVAPYAGLVTRIAEGQWRLLLSWRGRAVESIRQCFEAVRQSVAAVSPACLQVEMFSDSPYVLLGDVRVWAARLSELAPRDASGSAVRAFLLAPDAMDVPGPHAPPHSNRAGTVHERGPAIDMQGLHRYRPPIRRHQDGMPAHSSLLNVLGEGTNVKAAFFRASGGYLLSRSESGSLQIMPTYAEIDRELPRVGLVDGVIQRDLAIEPMLMSASAVRTIVELAEIGPDDDVLDMFTGSGGWSLMAAAEAKEVWSIDSQTGVSREPELNRKAFETILAWLPVQPGFRLAPTHYLTGDLRKAGTIRDLLLGRRFSRILADPPFGWGSKECEADAIATFIASLQVVCNHLQPGGSAYFAVPRFWLRSPDVKAGLGNAGLGVEREWAIPEGSVLVLAEIVVQPTANEPRVP